MLVATGALLLGFAPIGVRLSDLGPIATGFWRLVLALPVLLLLAHLGGQRPARLTPQVRWALIGAGICFGLDLGLWHVALTLTSVANATLLSNMTPLIAAAAAWLLFKERPGRGYAVGVAVAVAGAIALSLGRAGAAAGEGGRDGDLLALASAVWYAAYLLVVARLKVDVRAAMAWTTAASALTLLAGSLLAGEPLWPARPEGWLVLAALALVAHVGGQGLIAAGLTGLPLSVSTVLLWVQPLAAAAIAWVLFNEHLGPVSLAGAALLLGGIYIVQRTRQTT